MKAKVGDYVITKDYKISKILSDKGKDPCYYNRTIYYTDRSHKFPRLL